MASLRSDRSGSGSLISASRTAAGLAVVSLGATAALSPARFLAPVLPFLVASLPFTVEGFFFLAGVVCASAAPATAEKARARRHNLIKCFFISLDLSIKVSE